MEQNEVELLVDKKVAEAKLEIAEKRNQFLLWFFGITLTIVGVAIPLFLSNRAADKVDESIKNMENSQDRFEDRINSKLQFDEKTLNQGMKDLQAEKEQTLVEFRKEATERIDKSTSRFQDLIDQHIKIPKLMCVYNGSDIGGKIITIKDLKEKSFYLSLGINNYGGQVAEEVRVYFYLTNDSSIKLSTSGWQELRMSDEKGFEKAYEFLAMSTMTLSTGYTHPLDIDFLIKDTSKSISVVCLLKVFYNNKQPLLEKFTIKINNKLKS